MPDEKPQIVMIGVPDGYRLVTDDEYSDLQETRMVAAFMAGQDPDFTDKYRDAIRALERFDV